MEAKGVAGRSAGGFEDYLGAIFLAERTGGIRVGISVEEGGKFGWGGVDCVPPVAVGIEDDCAGAEDLLDAVRVFSCDADDHVDEFGEAEGLADEWADADKLGVVFGIFDGDLGGEWHGDTVSEKIFAGDRKWTRRGIEILCRAYGAGDWSVFVFPPLAGSAKFFRAYGACDLFRGRRPADEWNGEWGGRRRRVPDAPLRFICEQGVIRIWELGGRGLCRLGLCRRWLCLLGGCGRL